MSLRPGRFASRKSPAPKPRFAFVDWQVTLPFASLARMELEEQLERFLLQKPVLGKNVFMARGAVVAGAVTLGHHSSVWHNAVLRGDINRIVVGHHSNLQDNCVAHVSDDLACVVGDYVTVGHGAILHACTIGNGSLVGMGAVVLDGAVIGEESLIGARALVPQGLRVPPRSLVVGVPGRVVRQVTAEEQAWLRSVAEKYARLGAFCLERGLGAGSLIT